MLYSLYCQDNISKIKWNIEYTISTSYGIATRPRGSYTSIEDIMVEADEAMYKFKEEHR